MAKLQFIRGAVTGKLGEFVGAKWKGINYIRLHSNPANPRTAGQVSVRKVFKAVSSFAVAVFSLGLEQFIPSARRMTERNSVFKANKQMFTDKIFEPLALQVFTRPNLNFELSGMTAQKVGANAVVSFASDMVIRDLENGSQFYINLFVYDTLKQRIVTSMTNTIGFAEPLFHLATQTLALPVDFGTPEGSQLENCYAYLVFTRKDEDGHPFISKTYAAKVTA